MPHSLRSLELSCPFKSVILRDATHEVMRAALRVADDLVWTLETDLQLDPGAAPLDRATLVWCGDNDAELVPVAWDRVRNRIGSGQIPAGTSLLGLLSRM